MVQFFFFLALLLNVHLFSSDPITQPPQPENGPGGMNYSHQSVIFQDFASQADGYWLFEPDAPKPDSAHVVVFVHGYGGYNPMIYGKWIKHLVRKGNIVIYPRYQLNMLSPHPDKFSENVSKAVRDALSKLEEDEHVRPIVSELAFIGHSYGGVVSADLAINFKSQEIPQPKAVMLCSPGTGRLNGGRLESYAEMPDNLHLLILTNDNDWVVGDEFALKVFKEATSVKQRNLLRQFADDHGEPPLAADHNQSYSLDTLFDSGVHNYTAKRALRISTEDAVDYNGYWKLLDAVLDCRRYGTNCHYAYGGTPEQTSLGYWSDGTPIRPLEVTLPDE